MKNKGALSLMEQLVMILVFALAAALCLGAFAKAQTLGQTTDRRETAARIAQNGAERLKAGGDLEDLELPEGYYAVFSPSGTKTPGVCIGTVEVWHTEEKEPVFVLSVAWQEELP